MIRISIVTILFLSWASGWSQFYPTGGYQGGGYGSGGDKTLDVVVVDLKVLLQGPYRGGAMQCDLDNGGYLPLEQPYDSAAFYWHYPGTEAVDSLPSQNIVDWIEIELRETTGSAATATGDSVIGRRAGFLLSNGTITDLDGSSELRFKYVRVSDNLFAVIKHRNHLGIMNAAPLALTGPVYGYDFTTAQAKAYQNPSVPGNPAMADLGGGTFGMWGGNARADQLVKYTGPLNDRETILNTVGTGTPSEVIQGYSMSDVNLDARVRYMGADNDKVFIYNVLGGNEAGVLQSHVP